MLKADGDEDAEDDDEQMDEEVAACDCAVMGWVDVRSWMTFKRVEQRSTWFVVRIVRGR